jgi:hypothetical protein
MALRDSMSSVVEESERTDVAVPESLTNPENAKVLDARLGALPGAEEEEDDSDEVAGEEQEGQEPQGEESSEEPAAPESGYVTKAQYDSLLREVEALRQVVQASARNGNGQPTPPPPDYTKALVAVGLTKPQADALSGVVQAMIGAGLSTAVAPIHQTAIASSVASQEVAFLNENAKNPDILTLYSQHKAAIHQQMLRDAACGAEPAPLDHYFAVHAWKQLSQMRQTPKPSGASKAKVATMVSRGHPTAGKPVASIPKLPGETSRNYFLRIGKTLAGLGG